MFTGQAILKTKHARKWMNLSVQSIANVSARHIIKYIPS